MRLIGIMTLFLVSSCVSTAPKPPVVQRCDLISVEGVKPYLRCKWSQGSEEVWRIPIDNIYQRPERYICTDDESYANAVNYGKQLNDWMKTHCQ